MAGKSWFFFISLLLASAQETPVFHSDTSLALVRFTAVHDNTYLSNLKPEDVQLLEDGKTVFTPTFSFTVEIPSPSSGAKAGESGIASELTVREGQKVVLGKIRLDDGDNAVFMVVTVKIL